MSRCSFGNKSFSCTRRSIQNNPSGHSYSHVFVTIRISYEVYYLTYCFFCFFASSNIIKCFQLHVLFLLKFRWTRRHNHLNHLIVKINWSECSKNPWNSHFIYHWCTDLSKVFVYSLVYLILCIRSNTSIIIWVPSQRNHHKLPQYNFWELILINLFTRFTYWHKSIIYKYFCKQRYRTKK